MAILKADIESFLNTCLEDSVAAADLAEAIKLCLRDISNINLLTGEDDTITLNLNNSGVLTVGDLSFDVPDEYKDVESILLSDTIFTGVTANARLDSAVTHAPLKSLSGGHKEYRRLMEDSPGLGTPEYFSEFNRKFYLWPAPDKAYDVLVEYYKYDTQDEDAIEFSDEFSNAIKFGTVYFYAMIKGRDRYINLWGPKYENEKEYRRLNMKKQPRITGENE